MREGPRAHPAAEIISQPDTSESKEHLPEPIKFVIDKEGLLANEQIPEPLKETLRNLPERLTFEDSLTLIVGPNGSGKSQLARALAMAYVDQSRVDETLKHPPYIMNGEPAAEISKYITVETPSDQPVVATVLSAEEILGKISRTHTPDMLREKPVHLGSTRKAFEQGIEMVIREQHEDAVYAMKLRQVPEDRRSEITDEELDGMKCTQFLILDEIETGLDPQTQLELLQKINEHVPEGAVVLTVTNNLILWGDPNLCRLDLHEENLPDGVFRPGETGKGFQVSISPIEKA